MIAANDDLRLPQFERRRIFRSDKLDTRRTECFVSNIARTTAKFTLRETYVHCAACYSTLNRFTALMRTNA